MTLCYKCLYPKKLIDNLVNVGRVKQYLLIEGSKWQTDDSESVKLQYFIKKDKTMGGHSHSDHCASYGPDVSEMHQ